jgi:coenzyme F420 hydrogenase subunit beta
LVDGVLQVMPDPDVPTQNQIVVSTTPAEVCARSGSRYAPSSPLENVTGLLESGRRYAFVGKPCDIGALRQLEKLDPRVRETFPVKLSFFCGGVPSRRATRNLLGAMSVDESELEEFRYRGNGWPGSATATKKDGSRAQISYAESWGGYLSKIVQFRCKICPDSVGGTADIACADAWYGDEKGYPIFDEQDGRSAVIARTAVGERLLKAAVEDGQLLLSPLAIEELDKMQPSQARRKRQVLSRLIALKVATRGTPRAAGLALGKAARMGTLAESARSFAGLLYRLWQSRRTRSIDTRWPGRD